MLTLFASGRAFLVLMSGATLGPFLLALICYHTEGAASKIVQLLTLVAAPHVFATLYLLLDRGNLAGISKPGVTVFAIPVALMILNCAVLLAAPLWAVLAYMLVYVHISMWHFGRQNLGVVAFATRVGNGRPMDTFERRTLIAGTIAGVLGGYHMFAPTLMLHPGPWPLDLEFVDPLFSRLWWGGIAIYAILVPMAVAHVLAHRERYDAMSVALYLGCVFFFLPAYLSTHPLFLLVGWSVAHGAQYLVFLAFHAGGKADRPVHHLRALAPLALFLLCLGSGVVIWRASGHIQDAGDHDAIRLAIATTTALTLAHYWVDQFLWKFGNPERRTWLANSYRFLARTDRWKARPAVPALRPSNESA